MPPNRYAVSADVASTSGTSRPAWSAVGMNVCSPMLAVVCTTK